MLLTKPEIATLIPHSGAMVLLDAVLSHDAHAIHCLATNHAAADNPLRENGRLAAWCGIEYAAQAMAVHHRLCGTVDRATPAHGMLAVARDIEMTQLDLDSVPGDLHIRAEKIVADDACLLYQFRIECEGQLIVSGRVTIALRGDQQ